MCGAKKGPAKLRTDPPSVEKSSSTCVVHLFPRQLFVHTPACNRIAMACPRYPLSLLRSSHKPRKIRRLQCPYQKRRAYATAAPADISDDVVPESSLHAPPPSNEQIKSFDPIARSRRRKHQLPPSRSASIPNL